MADSDGGGPSRLRCVRVSLSPTERACVRGVRVCVCVCVCVCLCVCGLWQLDLVGYTALAFALEPMEAAAILHSLFCDFDAAVTHALTHPLSLSLSHTHLNRSARSPAARDARAACVRR